MGNEKGLLLVVLAPSGGGKGTILSEVRKADANIRFSVSATTRAPRPGENEGEHYYFMDREAFQDLVDRGEMLEYAEYCGNLYGTPKGPVDRWRAEGYDVILEIEVQGGEQVKRLAPDCVSVFITPPSMAVLAHRLTRRGTEAPAVIAGRLETAKKELTYAGKQDYLIINDKLEDAIADLQCIIRAEKLRAFRQKKQIEEVQNEC